MVDLEFEKSSPSYLPIDTLTFDFKLKDDMKITYDEKPCKIYFKTVPANVIRSHPLKRNKYLFANNVNWFFRYGVENICKFDEFY